MYAIRLEWTLENQYLVDQFISDKQRQARKLGTEIKYVCGEIHPIASTDIMFQIQFEDKKLTLALFRLLVNRSKSFKVFRCPYCDELKPVSKARVSHIRKQKISVCPSCSLKEKRMKK